MYNKIKWTIMTLLLGLSLTGCWDYIGIDEMTIVTGIAIDKNQQTQNYELTFETISLMESTKEEGFKTKLIEATGKNLLDTIRNAKKRVVDKLYFSDMKTIVISNEIAKTEGIGAIINALIGDAEIREKTNIIISQEETAKQILNAKGIDNPSTAYEVRKIIDNDNDVTSSTKPLFLYEAFNTLREPGASLVAPAFHLVKNDDIITPELNGIGVFKDDKLIYYIDSIDSKYFLFIADKVNGGVISLSTDNSGKDNIALKISENRTSKKYSYNNNKIKIEITTITKVDLHDASDRLKAVGKKEIDEAEKKAESLIVKNIKQLVAKAQKEINTDIFGFGNLVYRHDPLLWKKLKNNWDEVFMEIELDVTSKVKVMNTGFTK
ncbi:MAG: Ger(x)C family spore germination protein [Bacilli bacterium]|nr:Ger(x)C family spore germination protein [Bacilli bacterium]